MGFFSHDPTQDEARRHQSLAYAFHAYGFAYEPDCQRALQALLPLPWGGAPTRFGPRAVGQLGDVGVEVFSYAYRSKNQKGKWRTVERVLCVARHPWIEGGAWLYPDAPAWDGGAAFLDAILWLPPFIFVRLMTALHEARHPDLVVGDPAFDRRYVVQGDSPEAARRAISPTLRGWLVQHGFRGSLALRPGMLLYTLEGARLTPESVPLLLSYARPLAEAARTTPAGHPLR